MMKNFSTMYAVIDEDYELIEICETFKEAKAWIKDSFDHGIFSYYWIEKVRIMTLIDRDGLEDIARIRKYPQKKRLFA